MAVRLNDVAKHAGVALDTARRALDGASSVRPYLKERVEAAANELGYHPNLMARALKKKELWVVPVTVIELNNPFFGGLAQSLSDELVAEELEPILCVDPQHLLKLRRTICAPAGILAVGLDEKKVREISAQMKLVTINSSLPELPGVTNIDFDFRGVYREVCDRMKREGRRTAAVLSPFHTLTRKNGWRNPKTEAILEACSEVGLKVEQESGESIMSGCGQVVAMIQNAQKKVDAVFCENDFCAAELGMRLIHKGLEMPRDVRLVGCDGNFSVPGLWSLKLDVGAISRAAVGMLQKLCDTDTPPTEFCLQPQLIEVPAD